jgi:hypothetical protein
VNTQQQQRSNYRSAPRQTIAFRATQVATVPAIMPDGTIGRIAAPAPAPGAASAPAPPPRVRGLMGPMSAAQVAGQLSSEVMGRSRVKFFKRPVVPYLDAGAGGEDDPQAQAEAFAAAQAAAAAASAPPQVVELTRTLGTQSDYRESETQTDPYTPDYITAPEEPEPEILGLAHLTYGQGLPASMAELKLIERMRDKRAFEASLPPITDAASFEKRKQMLEARELAEWALREEEMKEEQEARLAVLVDTLKVREAKIEELSEARVDLVRAQALRERETAFEQIHRERIKLHRGLGKQRQALDAATAHMSGGSKELTSSHTSNRRTGLRDIVSDYADHASQVYAPVQRQGKLPVKNQVVDYGIPLLSNFQGLSELERSMKPSTTSLAVAAPKLRPDGRLAVPSLASRKGEAIRADLEYVDGLLEQQRAEGGVVGIAGEARKTYGKHARKLVENVYKKFEPVQRAPTPSVSAPDDDEASRAILLLQRLLRGRMVQNAMYEGRAHAQALIAELRLDEQDSEDLAEDPDAPLHHALDTLQGELVGGTLAFAAQEVLRGQQERAVAQLVKQAQLERRHREAEESGRRQAEAVMRLKRERQLREIMDDHALTADRFVEDVLHNAVARYADSHATAAAGAAVSSTAAAAAVSSSAIDEPDVQSTPEVVGLLVSDFLLPEVDRRRAARHAELQDRRFGKLAHEAVLHAVASIAGVKLQRQEEEQQQQPQQQEPNGQEEEEE